jgi:hypothetical protein
MAEICTITATTGHPLLERNLRSVNKQTRPIHHLVVIDGPQFREASMNILGAVKPVRHVTRSIIQLPENTGKEYVCHRIIGGCVFFINQPYVTFLDEDNEMKDWYGEDLYACIHKNPSASWGFFLRDIIDASSSVVTEDHCESMGSICPTFFGAHMNDRLVDTNCFIMKTATAVKFASCWYVKAKRKDTLDGDRRVTQALLAHEKGDHFFIRNRALVNYRVHTDQQKVFFHHGNDRIYQHTRFLRSARHLVYIFHFNKEQTDNIFNPIFQKKVLGEWCMTLLDDMLQNPDYCVLNGFKSYGMFAPGSYIVLNICDPSMLPCKEIQMAAKAFNCKVIANMALESPNVRHQTQFNQQLLSEYDGILTFWDHLLEIFPHKAVYMPHNARFFSSVDHITRTLPPEKQTKDRPYQVSICLECRDFDTEYTINGQHLRALDHMRRTLVTGLRSVVARGRGWTGVDLLDDFQGARHHDSMHPIDVYSKSVFALIVENCNCPGYISEKVQDAYMAGCIPLVYNGVPDTCKNMLPPGAYVDINHVTSGTELQQVLDAFTPEDVAYMQARVKESRNEYILSRGCATFTQAIGACIKTIENSQ